MQLCIPDAELQANSGEKSRAAARGQENEKAGLLRSRASVKEMSENGERCEERCV
jgi:hypothetical protein